MSTRKIKANSAEFDGDYVIIKRRPFIFFWAVKGFFIGLILGILAYAVIEEYFQEYFNLIANVEIYIFLTAVSAAIIVPILFSNDNEEYIIPRVDVAAIKKYPTKHEVTVIVDDARTKRKQPAISK